MQYKLALAMVVTAVLLAVLFGIGVSAEKTNVYAMQVAEVNELIDQVELPQIVFADRAHGAKHWRENDQVSVWALQTRDGEEMLRLTATTATQKNGTQVTVTVVPPDNSGSEKIKKALDDNPAIRDLFGAALAEQIDATMHNRPFSIANISRASARVGVQALLNAPAMHKSIDDAYARRAKEDREKYDRLYENR